ncbi:MAG: carbohydrate binding family 9 domain-containing protein, partial [Melioribacteraceae bacterium]|nr:carbohydrate binding family 9 domain-containing protein [Melioribacteraceae bacterium]
MKKQITLILIFTLQLIIAANQYDSNEIKVHAIKIENKIELDGKLDEPLYKNPPINNFTQRDPDEGEPATEKTSVWVGYDDSYIYVGVKLYDSDPELIDRMLVRKDNLSDSDWFFLAVDPYLDRRTGYYFGVNAGGSKADGILFNDSWDDDSWDGIWEVEVTIDDEGWTAEFKIPFSQMRFKEADDMKWGINFNRDIKRKNESSHFVMVP